LGVVLAVVAIAVGGCVAKDKYTAVVQESESAKAELEKIRAQKNALDQQVRSLKDANNKLVAEAELTTAELQRMKDSRDGERASIEGRVREQEQKIKELMAQHRALRQEYEEAKQRNETLKAAVARYQKELKERPRAMEPAPSPAPARPPMAGAAPAPARAAPAAKAPAPPTPQPSNAPAKSQPAVAPAPSAQQPGLAPVNINTASANDMVLFLGLTKEAAERVVSNRPYKVRGELVAKNVVPKATFDVIKDRITVAP
jgi:DNA uptake protein ComE-like DNA-binding protein